MQDILGSVRRSLVFRSTSRDDGGGFGGLAEKIGTSIRKSRIGLFSRSPVPALPPIRKDDTPPIRWRKGELIGCGAFGRVYMGMNLDSGELLAVKQVLIAVNSASKEKTQAHIQELEEEVKLLKNLSHPNIVRYLGTARENDSLNILLEFVPGGSISSLLGKFGSFPESVIRMYTKQLLLGLEYLHKNGIMHRDIKGANILVDNKGCIKLADFGASKKVVELATINGAKSMKGTPYWMAPEVILQTGHSFSADIWSVGCTVIEMATGKPPWSQQYQEVAALFHIGTTKSHPPIPEHLSAEAKDFLLKCLQKEQDLRASASDLLQHPFVTGEYQEAHAVFRNSVMESGNLATTPDMNLKSSLNSIIRRSTRPGLKDVCEISSVRCSSVFPESLSRAGSSWEAGRFDDDMCQIDDKDLLVGASTRFNSAIESADLNKSFNPMCEPTDEWACKFDESPEMKGSGMNSPFGQINHGDSDNPRVSGNRGNDFTFPCGPLVAEDDEEVTESKIRAFLDEKALDLKKLQTPLYKAFYGTLNAAGTPSALGNTKNENITNCSNLPPKSKSPKRLPSRRLSAVVDAANTIGSAHHTDCSANGSSLHDRALQEIQSPQLSEWKELILDTQPETISSSASFNERQRKWKEELDEELQRKREIIRQAALGGKTSSPNDRVLIRQRERLHFAVSGK
ncbi:mitogen-activated protein kinase kinase kinase NPK1 isoform X1 [Tripterygium wilfordii]|uniref:mitogen-activated protein kinase kinase kinase n=1 Tax=Tripterygium wilfordii TaxID=458696 RepID=A0A7J7CS94_TRIWF|nr:mitogen-activated protein kinase kinase kinase NPK1 [Tripterygium wilfordii]KAF5736839.1 mitogen-activated protein kinase kinase kinase NPK1 isoform X1 [Tripterygium wilfordii]